MGTEIPISGFVSFLLSGFMPNITNLTATTELEAVNAMLSAIGEAPVSSVDTAREDVDRAVNILRNKTRELQNKRWKFNTEYGLAISPVSTNQSWTDPDGTVRTLYIFTPPTGLSRWELSANSEQADFDVAVRPSKVYVVAALPVNVFYDRTNNRDGFEAAYLKSGKLWIDATWYFDFEKLPETARAFIVKAACRQFIVDKINDSNRAGFTESDVFGCWLDLEDDQGDDDTYSLLDSPDTAGILGGRFSNRGRGLDYRSDP
jgi:hypothetical protein